nr:hypothetical protein [Tanacetum cinerariifolium]
MGEPLSPDCVFDFPEDELELHPAYNFFAPRPLPGYASNLNNKNELNEANVPLFRELGTVADEPLVGPITDEIAEPVDEAEEHVIASVVGMDEEIAKLFGDDEFKDEYFSDDDSEEIKKEVAWVVNEEWLMAPVTPPLVAVMQPSSVYEVGDRWVQVGAQVVQVQQRDTQIQQLQTMVSETSSHESTLMQCILGLDKRLAALERRLPGP